MNPCHPLSAAVLAALMSILPASAQLHMHFPAGIVDVDADGQADAGEPLDFVDDDGSPFEFVDAAGVPLVFHLLPRPVGFRPAQRCGGYYMLDERPRTLFPNDAFSITALSDGQYDIAGAGHAHTGAWIWVEIVSVKGPAGGHFGFWNQNQSLYFDTPSVSLAANEPTGNPRFVVSEGIDDASEDPSGHIHGRSWTADKAGDYYVGLRLIDRSTTGPGGGPWHAPGRIHEFHFRAGPDFQPTGQRVTGQGYVLSWPSRMGISVQSGQTGMVFTILRSTTLAPGEWTPIGTITGTTGETISFTDPSPPPAKVFYQLSYEWSAP